MPYGIARGTVAALPACFAASSCFRWQFPSGLSIRNSEPIAFRSRRVLEVAAACRHSNSHERLKPVLEAFGIIHPSGQQQLKFDEDPDDD